MQNSKVSFRFLLYLIAGAVLSALLFFCAPAVYAQTPTQVIISDSDALAAAFADTTCSTITLEEHAIYSLTEPVTADRALTIIGNGATIDFGEGAFLTVGANGQLTASSVTFSNREAHSLEVSGSVIFGEKVFFAGKNGMVLNKNSRLTSGKNTVTAVTGMETLVSAVPADGTISLRDIRLAQTAGESCLLNISGGTGKIVFGGTVEIFAANGMAVFCPSDSAGPHISVENSGAFSVAAANAVLSRELDVPGAAVDVRSCDFSIGTDAIIGITGSYCGIAARNINIGDKTSITALCQLNSDTDSVKCAALSASDKLTCGDNVSITVGSSGGNFGTGMYSGKGISAGRNISVVFRGNSSYCCAVASDGGVVIGAEASIVSKGGKYGVKSAGFSVGDKSTLDINEVSADGIRSSGSVGIGTNATVNIQAARSAVYSSADISFSSGGIITLTSSGTAPALWLNGSSADNLTLSGCRFSVEHSTAAGAQYNSAICVSGAVTVENAADVTIINSGDIGLIAAGGSVNVRGQNTIMRCSGGVGVLVSKGSLIISDNAVFYGEGTLDSAVRIERGSFSATSGAAIDIQGVRFGIETMSGDVYIDGAASFDIRSTTDRAVFVENGRLTILNVDRLSVWDRNKDGKNSALWWTDEPEHTHSWEIVPCSSKSNWLYASHTALSPNLTHEHRQGVAHTTEFKWYDAEWQSADYSRIGQFCSRPSGRANSFNIPAGKSFSWMLFGASYDEQLRFILVDSTGDGTFDLREDGTFTYSSLDYSRGIQTFDFIVENSDGVYSLPVTVSIFVTASKPPVASSATYPIEADQKHIGQVNVVDYDGTIASISIEEQPKHGKLVMNSDGKFSYEPEKGYVGLDNFSYTAVDNMGDVSNTGYISLSVGMKETPVVCNATIITESSVAASTRLTALVGTETMSPAPRFVILDEPVYGVLSFDENEPDIVTYTPYEDFSGTDIFSFAAVLEDGTQTESACVTIATVPSQRPTAAGGIFYCTKNSSCSGRLTGYDIDGTITAYAISQQPENGRVELDTVTGEFVYHADGGYTGDTSFTFTVTDSDGLVSDPVQVDIRVTSLIDNLRNTGRLGAAIVLVCIALVAVSALIAFLAISSARKRREFDEEKAKSRLFEYGGSDIGFDDFSDRY